MDVSFVFDKKTWDDFLFSCGSANFLQSFDWGEMQKSFGRRVWRLGFFKDGRQVGASQIIEHYFGFGCGYLYIPRGPVGVISVQSLIGFLKKELKNYGRLFLRMEPSSNAMLADFTNFGARRASSIQPVNEWVIDLAKTEEEMLKETGEKTRYNIRLAAKKGLEFKIAESSEEKEKMFKDFWQIMKKTAGRDKIKLHSEKYYQLMLDGLPTSRLITARFQNKIAAGGIFLEASGYFYYLHGAFDYDFRQMMAPYFLHWEAIKLARARGFKKYNFGGVNLEDETDFDYKKSWEGITRFKKGFGGEYLRYLGTWELPLNKKMCKMFGLLKKIRKIF